MQGRKSVLLTDYIYVKKGYSVVFLIFYSKGYVEMTKIKRQKHIDKVLKMFVEYNSMTEKTTKSLNPVGKRPGDQSCTVYVRYILLPKNLPVS